MKIYNKIFIGVNVLLLMFLSTLSFASLSKMTPQDSSGTSMGLNINQNIPLMSEAAESSIKIMAVGDIMLGRYVETLMNRHGVEYPFSFWNEFNLDQDVILGNLEGPITANHVHTPDFTTSFSFQPRVADLLSSMGFTHLNLANNHTFDRGASAFYETMDFLTEAGITSIGHPRNVDLDYVIQENINGTDIVWIGINEAVSSFFDLEEAIATVSEFQDSLVVITIHWGNEYQLSSNNRQKEIAHALIDNGADLIIGHHPHVVQEIEIYNDKLIFYSLGNFIFDQYFSQDTQEGLVLYINFMTDQLEIELIPIESDMSRPRPMLHESSEMFLHGLAERSSIKLKEQIMNGEITLNNPI